MDEKYFKIGEVGRRIKREPHTIRVWGYQNRLPDHLKPSRDERNQRVWTEAQIEGIIEWMIETDLRPGKGIIKK